MSRQRLRRAAMRLLVFGAIVFGAAPSSAQEPAAPAPTSRPTPTDTREVLLKMQRRLAGLLDSAAENMSAQDEEAITQDLNAAAGAIDSMLLLARPAGEKPLLPAPLVGKLGALRDQLRALAKKPATASLTFRLPACIEVLEEIPVALAPPRPRPRPSS